MTKAIFGKHVVTYGQQPRIGWFPITRWMTPLIIRRFGSKCNWGKFNMHVILNKILSPNHQKNGNWDNVTDMWVIYPNFTYVIYMYELPFCCQ